jgi:hypothetical protein
MRRTSPPWSYPPDKARFTSALTTRRDSCTLCLEETSMEPESRSLFPGALEMMILQTLRRKPLHGYALAQLIKQNSDDLLNV